MEEIDYEKMFMDGISKRFDRVEGLIENINSDCTQCKISIIADVDKKIDPILFETNDLKKKFWVASGGLLVAIFIINLVVKIM